MTTRTLIILPIASFFGAVIITLVAWFFLFRDEEGAHTGQNTTPSKEAVEKAAPSLEARNPTACKKEQFTDFMTSREEDPPADLVVQVLSCKGKYAYARFEGDIGVHGAQSVLFRKEGEKYIDIVWGETSHGAISSIDPELGIDLCELAKNFPEMGTFFLTVNDTTCPSQSPS